MPGVGGCVGRCLPQVVAYRRCEPPPWWTPQRRAPPARTAQLGAPGTGTGARPGVAVYDPAFRAGPGSPVDFADSERRLRGHCPRRRVPQSGCWRVVRARVGCCGVSAHCLRLGRHPRRRHVAALERVRAGWAARCGRAALVHGLEVGWPGCWDRRDSRCTILDGTDKRANNKQVNNQ